MLGIYHPHKKEEKGSESIHYISYIDVAYDDGYCNIFLISCIFLELGQW